MDLQAWALLVGAGIGYALACMRFSHLREQNRRLRQRNLVLLCRLGRLGIDPEPPLLDGVRIHVAPGGRHG